MTYPFASLPENLAVFCAMLRDEYRFQAGPRELHDAARALEIANLTDERSVRDSLRPVLASRVEEAQFFDQAFDRFFGVRGMVIAGPGTPVVSHPLDHDHQIAAAGTRTQDRTSGAPFDNAAAEPGTEISRSVLDVAEADREARAALLRASYSPVAAQGPALALEPVGRAWREAAVVLVNQVRAGRSRRWQPANRGQRFDLRRTLRASLHTGGEIVLPRWRARRRRRPRFVVLIDGSRSMEPYVRPSLQMAIALTEVTPNVETFTFSTALSRVTRDIRRAARGERRDLDLRDAWGGGTTIGVCLREFLRIHAERVLGRDTLVIIASDGLDVGDARVLSTAMARISRLAASVVWLNPLTMTPGYEPTASGMSAAKRYVATFGWVPDPAAVIRLARTIRFK